MARCRSIVIVLFCLFSLPAAAALSFIQPLATPLVSTTNGSGVIGLAAGDFNGDGIVDLAVTRFESVATGGQQGFVDIMLGNGDGTFQAPTTIYTLALNVFAYGILAKDFDGDGKIDLAVAVRELHEVLWFKGDGNGGFAAPIATGTGHLTQGLQAADLNHDGILDLVALNPEDNSVSVLIGAGNGTFQAHVDYPVGSNPLDVAIGDVDGANGPDIVVANYGSANVGVLLNNGSGGFAPMVSFNSNMKPQGLYLADFDGDGKLDVVAGGNDCNGGNVDFSGCMVFMKGQGNGSFAVPTDANFTGVDSIPIRRFTENVAPDLNGDGKPDVVFVILQSGGFGKSQVMVGLSRGDGTFYVSYWVGAPSQPTAGANPDFVTGIAAVPGDFDKDGVLDLAFGTQGKDNTRGGVSILLGDTPGTFDVPRSYPGNYKGFAHGPPARGGVFGDFTGDGKVDLVAVDGGTDGSVVSPMLDTFRGNGSDSLADAITAMLWDPHNAGSSSTLRAADLDKNGTLDLVFFGPQSGVVASGNGDGTFTNFSSFGYAGNAGPVNMVIADFNGDGFPDLAIFENIGCFFPNASTQVEIKLQGAGGTKTFSTQSILPVNGICGGGFGLVAADFDKDSKADIVVPLGNNGNGTNASALFFKGNGDGTFQPPTTVGTGLTTINDYAAADLRKNGNLDLIGVGNGGVYVQLGNGDGTFQAPVSYGGGFCGDSRCGVKIADFDGDGIPDIAIAITDSFAGFAVLLGNGDGTFKPPVKFAVGATGASWLDIADLNGDGQPDIVVGHSGDNGNGYTVLINTSKPPTADLAISKSDSPDPVTVGNQLTYTITVTNNGPAVATGVTMTDTLPSGETFVSVTPSQGSCSGTAMITCNLGVVSNGASATVTLVVTLTQTGGISNTASVTANEFDPNINNNSATQVTTVNAAPSADLSITKSDSPDPVTVGSNLTYTITVKNNGPSGATGVTMTDSLPGTVTFVSATPSQGNCTGTATVTCNLGSLSNGAAATVTIVVTPAQAGGISNTAAVAANEADPVASNNSATETTTVNSALRQLTALSPARLWVGQNGSLHKLKYDLLAELLVDGVTVGTGQLSNVKAGGSAFNQAVFDTITLALGSPTAVPPGASLSIRASVRVSCATISTGVSSIARLWYNGQLIDKGKSKDAGSRFDATIGGTNSNYFLRTGSALATMAGNAKQFIDVAVNDASACPGRAFTPFGTWSVNLP